MDPTMKTPARLLSWRCRIKGQQQRIEDSKFVSKGKKPKGNLRRPSERTFHCLKNQREAGLGRGRLGEKRRANSPDDIIHCCLVLMRQLACVLCCSPSQVLDTD